VIVVLLAHPYPTRSRANSALVAAIHDIPGLEVRDLYRRYPDFDIDVLAEQAAMEAASTVVWMHPLYWYTTPALLKHWFDKVLVKGWAYGPGTAALRGKRCLWVPTTGGDEHAYSQSGRHHHPFSAFTPVVEETARYCGMQWLEPYVVHGAHLVDDGTLEARARGLRARLEALVP